MPLKPLSILTKGVFKGRWNLTSLLVVVVFLQVYLLFQNFETFRYIELHGSDNSHGYFPESDVRPNAVKLMAQDPCQPTNHRLFPLCKEKFIYMKMAYQLPCFKNKHDIDGSDCSVMRYLTEVEPFCVKAKPVPKISSFKADFRDDLDGLLKILSLDFFDWIKQRTRHIWPQVVEASRSLKEQKHFQNRRKKKIFFFLGSIGFQLNILKLAGRGGFVGELVQWTDLMATSYALGHDITVAMYEKDLNKFLPKDDEGCASKDAAKHDEFDLIFSDVNGVLMMHRYATSNYARLRCKIRLLDSFGTEAEFNYGGYDQPILGGPSMWGRLDLQLQQFLTYFPHSPDNTFLGFIAGSVKEKKLFKKNQALIYGKLAMYLDFVDHKYLDTIKDYFEVHSTFAKKKDDGPLPSYIVNHGVVKSDELKKILEETKLFIGLGFPFEGPGALEAVANGAVFLNPKFSPAKNKLNDVFFKEKPTLRKVTSQNPYMEDFIGEPYVFTVDPKNITSLVEFLKNLKKSNSFKQYLPREFTAVGMMERVHALIQHQDFCDPNAPRWPPIRNLEVYLAPRGVSCKNLCRKKGKICEPSYFSDINVIQTFESAGLKCKKTKAEKRIYHPSYNALTGTCFTQEHFLYFSCVAENAFVNRLCPCRNFVKGQTALCDRCL
ncbi:alpha-1,6-mannosylglycoprotein 6-beta-N-acetylglucosaminyltransferase A-like isoform X1 [Rhopilema esculentum]|uniref:alpha-1,6-mannosylglycoprotein 6-beta-N-acetylglucosaminyltransferase A-like isoform X1 n=2 Tax=Rhopilema esculentum TaxID=499914 RepID=UPI0031E44517